MIQTLNGPCHRFLQQILSFLPLAVVITDKDGRILYFNLMAEQITGYSQEEILGKLYGQLDIGDSQHPCTIPISEGRHNPRLVQTSIRHKDGHKIPLLRGVYPLKNDQGKSNGALETLLDISWNQKASHCIPECLSVQSLAHSCDRHLRELIERSKSKLLGIFDEIIDGLFMIDNDYRINAINKTQASYLDNAPKVFIKNYCYQVMAHRTSPCPDCMVEKVFKEGKTRAALNIKCGKDINCYQGYQGAPSYVNVYYIPIKTDLGQVHDVLIYIQDISKLKELEEGVRRTENLAGLGILASGVAHEINNPLQVILSGANCLIKKRDNRDIVLDVATQIKECAEKMANIIKDLSLYSRGIQQKDNEGTLIHIKQILDDSILMASHVRNMGKVLITEDYQQTAMILGNPSQFQQIFVNLIINAVDAMEGKGSLVLKTFQRNGFVEISVEDTGCGIPDNDLPYIFDPFFTTKDPGQGTGLGLNVVYRLVNQYKGKIHVKSKKGEGTSFIVNFPKALSREGEQ
ncbi:MAG: PAS domain-containing protein [Deltaproteobacteria bacterium]|nr:PAS domain-containing protein [Deltaproteobacteria bacterium]